MATDVKVPPVGESITEVVIGEWLRPVGSKVAQDEPVVTLETDKVNIDVPAPVAGVVVEVLKQPGETAKVGDVIARIEAAEAGAEEAPSATPSPAPAPAASASAAPAAPAPAPAAPAPAPTATPAATPAVGSDEVPRVSPSTRRKLREGVELPSAPAPAASPTPAATKLLPSPVAHAKVTGPTDPLPEETVPMTPLRKRVAERLLQAQHDGALLTTFNEVDLSEVIALRKTHKDAFVKAHGVKLGFMSFFVKAVIEGLKAYPALNAEIRGTDIVYKRYYNIGVAVGGGKGLVVPVIRHAERLGMAEIEKTIADFGQRAKIGKIELAELGGGTFTISNGGIYGSMLSTPIINPPQTGILGMHAIQERAVVRDGQIVARPMMYVALTYDHRLVDGREAVSFLIRMKECLETPARILLEA